MEIIGLRYFNIFGPNQSPEGAYAAVIPLFMDAALNQHSPSIDGDGEQTRDFTFVENAVQANISALFTDNQEALNNVFNIAVGENISVNELYRIIQNIAGSSKAAFHRESRKGDIRNSLADISKAKKLLGYNPSIKTEEGLRITFEWFKSIARHV
jgi:UDP-N-acetylglucosamine 4-epimerase